MQFGRYYEEFDVGATYKHWPGKTITEADDHLFCLLTMNHHPLHTDAHYAETKTEFGRNAVSYTHLDVYKRQAKLFASETCFEVVSEALRVHGGYGFSKEYDVERLYRDAPLLIIGEGTNEIQRLIIAKGLLERYRITG